MTEQNKFNNDDSCLDDTLGMAQAGDRVAGIVLETPTPFTLGVVGKWGSGKTSLMRRAFAMLGGKPISQALPLGEDRQSDEQQWADVAYDVDKDKNLSPNLAPHKQALQRTLCVWYSPWRHQNSDNPLVPLLLEIKKQFALRFKMREKLTKLNRQGGLAALALLERVFDAAMSLSLGKSVKVVQGTSDAVRKAWREGESTLEALSDGQRFHLLFEDAVETVLEGLPSLQQPDGNLNDGARLIVFIDDLDRCEESQVVKLLEAIKLYLSTRRCVFVLGMDYNAVLGALKRVWTERSEDENREYLEKLFQAIVSVPLPVESQVRNMIRDQLIANAMYQNTAAQCDDLAQDIEQLIEPNPRKLKNFVNSLCASWAVLRCSDIPTIKHIRRFIMFHYLKHYHPAIWRMLERQPWALRMLYLIANNLTLSASVKNDENIDYDAQRMMWEFLSRSFSHVLKHDNEDASADDLHRKQPLDKAIDDFLDRLDRKRSDEHFLTWCKDNVTSDDQVVSYFLRIATPVMECDQ